MKDGNAHAQRVFRSRRLALVLFRRRRRPAGNALLVQWPFARLTLQDGSVTVEAASRMRKVTGSVYARFPVSAISSIVSTRFGVTIELDGARKLDMRRRLAVREYDRITLVPTRAAERLALVQVLQGARADD
jgi:hypothetical protein